MTEPDTPTTERRTALWIFCAVAILALAVVGGLAYKSSVDARHDRDCEVNEFAVAIGGERMRDEGCR